MTVNFKLNKIIVERDLVLSTVSRFEYTPLCHVFLADYGHR